MKAILVTLITNICILTLAGCNKQSETPSATEPVVPPEIKAQTSDSQIAWYEGSVDEAFAYAQKMNKPIFLYWGAVWCPPCHEIKVTVFDTPEFVQRSRLFVPVYLDGDTQNAQAIGERFGVLGYPTMIVFSSDGAEITRIPGGIDIQAYATILDLTLENAKPVGTLLTAVLENHEPLSAADCGLLAYYSWGQNDTILAMHDEGDAFRQLYEACPENLTVDRSRLYLNYLTKIIDGANAPDTMPLSDQLKAEAVAELNKILDNYSAVKSNVYSILFDGPEFSRALTEPGTAERLQLITKYQSAIARIAKDEAIFKKLRLYTLIGKIGFVRIDDEKAMLSESLQSEIRSMIEWADTSTSDPYARQAVINGAANVLEEAGMSEEGRVLLNGEIARSKQPYYFMVSLADIEQSAGNHELALDLLKRAYDQATGSATRFQWGTYYVTGLIEMAPDDTTRIGEAVLSVVSEIEAEQAFYQRSTRYLQHMERKLRAWNKDQKYQQSIDQIRAGVLAMCAGIPVDKPSRNTCENFLEAA